MFKLHGGVIYHRLGEQFNSPTINLWIDNKEFIRFCERIQYYVSLDLCFIDSRYDYPVGRLDDICIYFNHCKTEEEAKELWYRRRERIDYDNIFFLLVGNEGLTKEDILRFSKLHCRNKLLISSHTIPYIDCCIKIRPHIFRNNGNRFMDKGLDLKWAFERKFDYVTWLNVMK